MNKIVKQEYINLNHFLKCRREVLNISRDKMASKLDVSIDRLSFWEDTILDNVDINNMKCFSRHLNFNPLLFIEGLPEDAYENWHEFILKDFIDLE